MFKLNSCKLNPDCMINLGKGFTAKSITIKSNRLKLNPGSSVDTITFSEKPGVVSIGKGSHVGEINNGRKSFLSWILGR